MEDISSSFNFDKVVQEGPAGWLEFHYIKPDRYINSNLPPTAKVVSYNGVPINELARYYLV